RKRIRGSGTSLTAPSVARRALTRTRVLAVGALTRTGLLAVRAQASDERGTVPDSLLHGGLAALGVALVIWILNVVTRECSWVDRLWSILPPLYVGYFWSKSGFSDPRLALMTVLTA